MMLKSKLNRIAQPKDLIENREKNLLTHQIINPFITKRKSPNVITVMGMVKNTRIGFTMKLKKESTTATGMAA
jgi:hypothetical protein